MTLRDRLKALTAPCREVDAEIAVMFRDCPKDGGDPDHPIYYQSWQPCTQGLVAASGGNKFVSDKYTASLDATVELVEREMPGKNWSVVRFENRTTIVTFGDGDRVIAEGKHTLPAVALLLALLDAKEVE